VIGYAVKRGSYTGEKVIPDASSSTVAIRPITSDPNAVIKYSGGLVWGGDGWYIVVSAATQTVTYTVVSSTLTQTVTLDVLSNTESSFTGYSVRRGTQIDVDAFKVTGTSIAIAPLLDSPTARLSCTTPGVAVLDGNDGKHTLYLVINKSDVGDGKVITFILKDGLKIEQFRITVTK
jgi:hypothetical protein